VKVYGLQYATVWEDKAANQQQIREMLHEAAPEPGSLVVLPELSLVGFTMRRDEVSESADGATRHFYAELSRQHKVTLVGGASWWGADGLGRNMALVLGPDGELQATYCKQHPFSFAGETNHYESGREFATFEWGGARCAPLVCYDLRFPETFRHLVAEGVELFVVIANWPTPRVHHWEILLQARAVENQAYVLGVNRCGSDPNVPYPGSTRLIDPQGAVVSCLDDRCGCLRAELDLPALRAYRERFPALRDLLPHQLGR
jgi:omega-amidase